jgi:ABC-type glycerol-3-phosphate transport system substrate-binding protein
MKKFAFLLLASPLLLAGCTTSNQATNTPTQTTSSQTQTVDEAVKTINEHKLVPNAAEKPIYQFIQAYDGQKYKVDGDYVVEIYTFAKAKGADVIQAAKITVESADTPAEIRDNVLFVFQTTDLKKIQSLLDDWSISVK